MTRATASWAVGLLSLFLLHPGIPSGRAADAPPAARELISPNGVMLLSGGDWKLGSFAPDEGERLGAFKADFDESGFRTVTVPGEVQLQIGLKGMDLYFQGRELTFANNHEWWYRKEFTVPCDFSGKNLRLVFDGVDYFCSVWLNGTKLGDHEGAYVRFEYGVSSLLNRDGVNRLAVKVTCPWLPKGRGFLEYMKGELVEAVPGTVTEFPGPPFVLGPTWDGLPAGGNAAFPMGLFRDVKLVASGTADVTDLTASTKSINADGSATILVSGCVTNRGVAKLSTVLKLQVDPENFTGQSLAVPSRLLELAPGKNRFEQELVVAQPRLWWTWDTGEQNLYRAKATISPPDADVANTREAVFGIRTIAVKPDMGYWLNGRRLFLKGAWYPMSDIYGSKPTRETYAQDLELFRAANLNHLINFTLVEKPDFYDLCGRLGILNLVELPFLQFGPMAVLDQANPRRAAYVEQALSQVRKIILELRNHPSIIVWAPFAEALVKGRGWGVGSRDFEKYGYQEFSESIRRMVTELSPGTIYHPSFCDAGEQHFWMGTAGPWRTTPYQEQYQADTGFVSEYGFIALPGLQSLEKILTPGELWSEQNPKETRWHELPIDVTAYSYQTSFDYIGLAGTLDRVNRFVDTDLKSAQELVDGSQLYQGFLFQYATEAYRRRKYHSINGTRIWAYMEPTPGIRFGFVDYYRVPKMGYYYLKRAQAPFAVSFEFEDALESHVAGKAQKIPVWLLNDHLRTVPYDLHCEITDLHGRTIWTRNFRGETGADSVHKAGVVEWVTPDEPGIYTLRAQATEKGGSLAAESRTYIKVTPRILSRSIRLLLIGHAPQCRPLSLMAENLGLTVKVIDEASIGDLALLRDPAGIRRDFDVVWLASFDSLWKLLDDQAAEGLKQAVRDGVGFVHSGGLGSFHGGSIRASLLNLTPLAELLPVRMLDRDDVFLGEPPPAAFDALMNTSPIRGLKVPAGAEASWKLKDAGAAELSGFNRVVVAPGSKPELTVLGWPLVVTGRFGKGHTVAYMGFTPSWSERKSPWDRKMVSSYFLDQELVSDPEVRTCFVLAARIIAAAVGEAPAVDPDALLATRVRPLFETLQDSPTASLMLPASVQLSVTSRGAAGELTIRNGNRFARLVRVRAEWEKSDDKPPYLVMYGDNYFDLMPGESKVIPIGVRLPRDAHGRITGRFVVEGSNVSTRMIPIHLEMP